MSDDDEEAITRLAKGLAATATIAPAGTVWPSLSLPGEEAGHRTYALVKFEGNRVTGGGADADSARAALVCALIFDVTGEDCSPCADCGDPVGGDYTLCAPCIVACMRPL